MSHPLQKEEGSRLVNQEAREMAQIEKLYGAGLAMQLRYERTVLAEPERLLGRSSFLSLESHMGRLHRFDFADSPNELQLRPTTSMHEVYLASFDQP
jgi:hypothetical protein